jgi:hypothetical protein
MNDIAIKFLETYAAGGEADGGWMYGKALQQAKLDFTPDSLLRLDALLLQIRERAKPTRVELDSPQGRNFESLVAFYVIEFARRMSHATFHWQDRATALAAMPSGTPLEDTPGMRLVVDVPSLGALFKPLEWVEGQVLPGGEPLRAGDYIVNMLARMTRAGEPIWWTAMHGLGKLGSWQLMMAADNRGVWPTLVTSAAPDTLQSMERGDLELAVRYGDHLLADNPDNHPWQVFSYPGYAEHKGQRVAAVIVMAATYNDKPMRMKVAFPFRSPRDGATMAIWQPALVEGNLSVEASAKLSRAMERGIRDVKWSMGGSWNDWFVG